MNDIETNKQVCVRFFDLISRGQFDAMREVLHDDVEWWILGDLPSSGTHAGKDAVMKLFEMIEQTLAPPVKMNITALTAEEDRVAMEMNGDCTFLDGRPYRTVYHHLFRLKDGKVRRVNEYFDTKYVGDVFRMEGVPGDKTGARPAGA
jgi:ketosteroid isomerase-like protein